MIKSYDKIGKKENGRDKPTIMIETIQKIQEILEKISFSGKKFKSKKEKKPKNESKHKLICTK